MGQIPVAALFSAKKSEAYQSFDTERIAEPLLPNVVELIKRIVTYINIHNYYLSILKLQTKWLLFI